MFKFELAKQITFLEILSKYGKNAVLCVLEKGPNNRVRQKMMSVNEILNIDFSNVEDVYITYNSFKKGSSRKKKNVTRLYVLYVDIDIGRSNDPYLDEESLESKQRVINNLEKYAFGKIVPKPNYICDSGRGLYLFYEIYQNENATKREHSNAAKRWERVNSYLTSALEDYFADKSVSTDEARLLRIPESINSHNGNQVKFYKYSDSVYTLYNIERDYMSAPTEEQIKKLNRVEAVVGVKCRVRTRRAVRRFLKNYESEYKRIYGKKNPTEKQLKYASDISRVLNIPCPNFKTCGGVDRYIKAHGEEFKKEKAKRKVKSKFFASEKEKDLTLLDGRLKRLEKLAIEAPEDSYREIVLFLYRLFACKLTGNIKKAADMTRAVIRKMKNPLPEEEAMRSTKSAERYWKEGSVYKMKNATIANHFNMTVEEWQNLMPQIKHEEDKELRRNRNKRYRERKLKIKGELPKKTKIEARRDKISRLLSDGKIKDEICKELRISERTYYADIKIIKENMIKEEPQDIEKVTAKNEDALSNKGPLGPSVAFKNFLGCLSTSCVPSSLSFFPRLVGHFPSFFLPCWHQSALFSALLPSWEFDDS